jgi:hypothetical protein
MAHSTTVVPTPPREAEKSVASPMVGAVNACDY